MAVRCGPQVDWDQHHNMDEDPPTQSASPGQRLREARERLRLSFRQVEDASKRLAEKHGNEDYLLSLARLSDFERNDVVPGIHKLYSLCAIYRLDYVDVLSWYGVAPAGLPADWGEVEVYSTHLVGMTSLPAGTVIAPIAVDPVSDYDATIYVSRIIQKWGPVPAAALAGSEPTRRRYGLIGTTDCFMYPLLRPGCLVEIDENKTDIHNESWDNEYERPIYFVEHRDGYVCGWCSRSGEQLVLVPHPLSGMDHRIFAFSDVRVIGQVIGLAMRLERVGEVAKKRRTRS